jgi:hypothetical protein
MRKIEFKPGINTNTTRIFVDGVQLNVFFDNAATKHFRIQRKFIAPSVSNDLIRSMSKRLNNDVVNLKYDEIDVIINKFKEELGL